MAAGHVRCRGHRRYKGPDWSRSDRLVEHGKVFHVADCEVGHAPGTNFARRAQIFEPDHNSGEISVRTWPVQQIEIEMISAETGEARLASTRHAVSGHMTGRHFGDQEYAVALTGNHAANQFLGAAATIISAVSINVMPSERPVRSASSSTACRMSSLRETRRALAQCRDDCAGREISPSGSHRLKPRRRLARRPMHLTTPQRNQAPRKAR